MVDHIQNSHNSPINTHYQSLKAVASPAAGVAKPINAHSYQVKDSVMISPESLAKQEIARYSEKVKNLPDSNEQRIKEIQERVRNGSYDTPEMAAQIVDKLLQAVIKV